MIVRSKPFETNGAGPVNGPMREYFMGTRGDRRSGILETFTYEYQDWCQNTRHRLIQVALLNWKGVGESQVECVWLPIATFHLN